MAIIFKSAQECATEYLIHLKGLKPEVDTQQNDSDWIVRGKALGSLGSGIYGDQALLANDPFPQSCRHDALGKHLKMYFDRDFNPPSEAVGFVEITAATGGSPDLPAGTVFTYEPNGNAYVSTETYTPPAHALVGLCPVQSVDTGQAQNLLATAPLTITSPPSGYETTAVVATGGLSDGTDPESDEQAKTELMAIIQNPIRGGSDTDWIVWAREADKAVTKASVFPYMNGLGTVGVVIASGTVDIDAAIDNGDAIIFTPSDALLLKVQQYLDAKRATDDCVQAVKVSLVTIAVSVTVSFANGDETTIPSGQTLTQGELVEREVKRAIYKSAQGGRKIAGSAAGYVVAADIEDQLDASLSAGPKVIGTIPILDDRAVSNLDGGNRNIAIAANQQAVPGTITVTVEAP